MPDIDGRAVLFDREFDDADRAVDPGAKAARRGDQQVERKPGGAGGGVCGDGGHVLPLTRLLARAKGGSYGARRNAGPVPALVLLVRQRYASS